MSATMSGARPVELDDVQGLVRFGYKHLTEACFLLLRITDAAAARSWLAQAPVTSAVNADPLPQTALHVAFTSQGLRALEVAPDLCAGFSAEFVAGMASDGARARRLGDIGANDPATWRWGTGARTPHVAVLLYAAPGQLEAWELEIAAKCAAGFELIERLSTSVTQLAEPFGFADGISQPKVDWERERPLGDHDRLDYDNLVCLGEFLLGYPNEYGLYTPRPLLAPQCDPGRLLPRAEDAPEQADVGRNGSYLVLRQLRQDVESFWRELDRQAGGDQDLRERLAAAMVGRKKNGEPLAAPGNLNDFTYEDDPRGLRCPVGAHIRRSNPRNADLPPGGRGPPLATVAHARIRRCGAGSRSGRVDTLSSSPSPRPEVRGCRNRRPIRRWNPRCGRRHSLHVPYGQHQAPVRVRAKRVAGRKQVRRPHRRTRSDGRPPFARRRELSDRRLLDSRSPVVRTAV
jgi:hypothetical protein